MCPKTVPSCNKVLCGVESGNCACTFVAKKATESWLPAIFALDYNRLSLWDPFDFSMLNVWKVGKQCKPTEKKRILRQCLKHIYIIIKSVLPESGSLESKTKLACRSQNLIRCYFRTRCIKYAKCQRVINIRTLPKVADPFPAKAACHYVTCF